MLAVAGIGLCASLAGTVVAWRLIGALGHDTDRSLALAQDSLETLDDTIDVAETVVGSVDTGLGTLEEGLRTMSGATAGTVALSVAVADLTAAVPDTLDDVDTALGRLQSLGATVDAALRQLSQLPVGPDYDPDISFDGAVAGLREDLALLADRVRDTSGPLDDFATSAEPVPEDLEQLADDVGAVRTSLAASGAVLERYRITAAEAATLAEGTREDLDGEVTLARVLSGGPRADRGRRPDRAVLDRPRPPRSRRGDGPGTACPRRSARVSPRVPCARTIPGGLWLAREADRCRRIVPGQGAGGAGLEPATS